VGIEPAGGRGAILRQQAIGADDPAAVAACCRIDDEQMVAYGVELVRVEPLGSRFTAGMPLLVEHLETQLLRGGDLVHIARKPHLERSDPAEQNLPVGGGDGPAAKA